MKSVRKMMGYERGEKKRKSKVGKREKTRKVQFPHEIIQAEIAL